jgi:hypothetical protein
METGMADIKVNGKLKSMLNKCNHGEAISRISQCARDQDINSLGVLRVPTGTKKLALILFW